MTGAALHWSSDHCGHMGGTDEYSEIVAGLIQSATQETSGHYVLLPNFTFDHRNIAKEGWPAASQGFLQIARPSANWGEFRAHRFDRTSGVSARLEIQRWNGGSDMLITSSRTGPQGSRATTAECRRYPGEVIPEYELFDKATNLLDVDTFWLLPADSSAAVRARMQVVDTFELEFLPSDFLKVSVAVCVHRAGAPTYWWIDGDGRVLLSSATLWTYVISNGRRS